MKAHHYSLIGGVYAWRIPLASGAFAACALASGDWKLAALLLGAGMVAYSFERLGVIEVSSAGLARGLYMGGAIRGPAQVVGWGTIDRIEMRWRSPRDFTGLETIVSSRAGVEIRFTTRMGMAGYRTLVQEIVRLAPGATHTGLTAEFLAESVGDTGALWEGAPGLVAALGAVLLLWALVA